MEESLIAFPAVRRLEALLDRGMDAVPSRVRRALEEDDYSRALSDANRQYARRGAEDPLAVLVYGCLLVGRELVVEARGLLDKAIKAQGERPEYVALMADAFVLEGEPERARDWLTRLSPDEIERPQLAAFIADVHLDLGDEDEAITYYQAAVDAGIDDVEAAIRLGQLHLGEDRHEEAAKAFEYGAELGGDRLGLWRMTSDLWFELGEDERALRAERRLLELEEASADRWLRLGLRLAGFRRFDEALDALDEAHQLEPLNPEPLLSRGHILLEMGRAEDAMAAFNQLKELTGESAQIDFGLASAALLIGDLGLAKSRAERAVERDPDNPDAHHTLGVVRQEFGRHKAAIEAFDKALELDDDRPEFYQSRALSLAAVDRPEEAISSMDAALAHSADAVEGAADLVLEFIKRGKLDEARQTLEAIDTDARRWPVIESFLETVLALLEGDTAVEQVSRLEKRLEEDAEVLPVELDYPGWRRIARSVGEEPGRRIEEWLDRLGGE